MSLKFGNNGRMQKKDMVKMHFTSTKRVRRILRFSGAVLLGATMRSMQHLINGLSYRKLTAQASVKLIKLTVDVRRRYHCASIHTRQRLSQACNTSYFNNYRDNHKLSVQRMQVLTDLKFCARKSLDADLGK